MPRPLGYGVPIHLVTYSPIRSVQWTGGKSRSIDQPDYPTSYRVGRAHSTSRAVNPPIHRGRAVIWLACPSASRRACSTSHLTTRLTPIVIYGSARSRFIPSTWPLYWTGRNPLRFVPLSPLDTNGVIKGPSDMASRPVCRPT